MVADIFQSVGEAISAFTTALGNAMSGVTSMFYDAQQSQLTVLGTLLTIGIGVAIVYYCFRLIKGLVKRA